MSKFVKRSQLQKIYFDRVIHLYFEENLGYTQISHLVPIGRTTILEWVHRYLDSGLDEVIEMKAKKKKRQDRNEDRGLFKPWIFLIADCSMDTGTMWIPAVFDSGWKNFVFCRLFFILPFPGTL